MKIKKIFFWSSSILVAVTICLYQITATFASDAIFIDENYTTAGLSTSWTGNNRGNAQIISDSAGEYLSFEYSNSAGTAPTYYDYSKSFDSISSEKMVCNFDIKFSISAGSENLFLGQRESSIYNKAVRIQRISSNTIMYYSGSNKYYGNIVGDNWYNVRIVIDVDNKQQSLYITDKYSGNSVLTLNKKELYQSVDYINMISIGASSTICIDNLKIAKVESQGIHVIGNPYLERPHETGKTNQYEYKGILVSESGILMDAEACSLQLAKEVQGVSINGNVICIDNTAPIGPIELIMVSNENSNIQANYLVEIEN